MMMKILAPTIAFSCLIARSDGLPTTVTQPANTAIAETEELQQVYGCDLPHVSGVLPAGFKTISKPCYCKDDPSSTGKVGVHLKIAACHVDHDCPHYMSDYLNGEAATSPNVHNPTSHVLAKDPYPHFSILNKHVDVELADFKNLLKELSTTPPGGPQKLPWEPIFLATKLPHPTKNDFYTVNVDDFVSATPGLRDCTLSHVKNFLKNSKMKITTDGNQGAPGFHLSIPTKYSLGWPTNSYATYLEGRPGSSGPLRWYFMIQRASGCWEQPIELAAFQQPVASPCPVET